MIITRIISATCADTHTHTITNFACGTQQEKGIGRETTKNQGEKRILINPEEIHSEWVVNQNLVGVVAGSA